MSVLKMECCGGISSLKQTTHEPNCLVGLAFRLAGPDGDYASVLKTLNHVAERAWDEGHECCGLYECNQGRQGNPYQK